MDLPDKEKNMNYQEAITAVKNGSTVKRTSWTNKTIKQHIDLNGNASITCTQTKTITAPYISSRDDMYADDWQTI